MLPITADSADSDSEEIPHEKSGSDESGSHGNKVDDSHDNMGLSESKGEDEDNVASQSRNKTKEKTSKITQVYRPPDKSVCLKIVFLISQPKHMLRVLKRTVSMRRFF